MTKPFPLQPLLELARSQTDAVTRKLGATHARQLEGNEKLSLLVQFRSDYERRYERAAAQGMDAHAMTNYQQFLARLDLAISQQREALAQIGADAARRKLEWQAECRKLKTYDTLAKRHANAAISEQKKKEQREADEHALISRRFIKERDGSAE